MKIQTANQLRGMATGVIFMAFFGGVWFFFALLERQIVSVSHAAGVALGMAVLLVPALTLFRTAKRWPRVTEDSAARRTFNQVNAAQWIAGFALFYVLRWIHLDDYFMSALTAIVGLHFFPLAKIYHNPAARGTGAILVAWAVASVVFVPVEHLPSSTGFGTGLILWHSAAITLSVALQAVRESGDLLTPLTQPTPLSE
jgi:hypothetical protein